MTPISAGFIAAAVGFASSFAIVLQGLQHVGATSDQACSGLVALCVIQGIFSILLSLALKVPVSIVWSTPGAALLLASSSGIGHFNEMIGAFLVCAALITLTGLSSRLIAIVEWMPERWSPFFGQGDKLSSGLNEDGFYGQGYAETVCGRV